MCTWVSIRFLVVSLFLAYLSAQQVEPNKRRFCAQPYFDSVSFDGEQFRFVVQKDKPEVKSEIFTAKYNEFENTFNNFTRNVSKDELILQGALRLPTDNVEFYYREPLPYTHHEQVDFNAYEYYFQYYDAANKTHCSSFSDTKRTFPKCAFSSEERFEKIRKLFGSEIATSYTLKHRQYLYEPKSKLVWIVLQQIPALYGWAEWKEELDRNSWTYKYDTTGWDHFYTGGFTFRGETYLVQEKVSQYGLRHPNFIRQVSNLRELSFTDFQVPLNAFFNCTQTDGSSSFASDPDQAVSSLTLSMIIVSTIFAALLLLAFLIALILYHDSNRIISQLKGRSYKKTTSTSGTGTL